MKILSNTNKSSHDFTLTEMQVVSAIIGLLAAMLLPAAASAKQEGKRAQCLSNQRQPGIATCVYLAESDGKMSHHHEGWVLDDGTLVQTLQRTLAECEGGGQGASEAEKPWMIFFQPYLNSRTVALCPSDPMPRSTKLTTTLHRFNGGITSGGDPLPPDSEKAI